MRKTYTLTIGIALGVVGAFSLPLVFAHSEDLLEMLIDRQQKKVDGLISEIASLKQEVANLHDRDSQLAAELEDSKAMAFFMDHPMNFYNMKATKLEQKPFGRDCWLVENTRDVNEDHRGTIHGQSSTLGFNLDKDGFRANWDMPHSVRVSYAYRIIYFPADKEEALRREGFIPDGKWHFKSDKTALSRFEKNQDGVVTNHWGLNLRQPYPKGVKYMITRAIIYGISR